MTDLTHIEAVSLGIIQGLTEFLPISSSGHLAIAQRLMHLKPDTPAMIAFDLAVHLGTLVAVAVVFQAQIRRFLADAWRDVRQPRATRSAALLIAVLGIIACVPTAVIGLTLKDTFERAFDRPQWIAAGLLLTGALLLSTRYCPRPKRGWRRIGWWRALAIGIAQGIAITPGVSRSGSTISLALLLGVKRRWAGEFSFLIAAPAIAGAILLHLMEIADTEGLTSGDLPLGPVALGTVAATLSGYIALRFLIALIRRAQLHHFCYYCWLLAIAILIFLR